MKLNQYVKLKLY